METTDAGYRTDALPCDPGGTYVIESAWGHQLWAVSHPWVFQLGGHRPIRNDAAAATKVGPWRVVSIPVPFEVLHAQANHALPKVREQIRHRVTTDEADPEEGEGDA